ncbi:DUF551 domain-containing protein [Enterobacter cancerogenus]|jgi:hypothetical protein
MSELTKEWLMKTIAELEEERDAVPGAVNEDAAMALEAMKLALASLEAEPVAYMWDSDRKDVDAAGYYRPEHKIFAESSVKRYGGKVLALFTTPPATVDKNPLREFAMEYIESWDLGMAGDSSLLASARKAIADSEILQPAPVSVPDGYRLQPISEYDAMCAAMLQDAEHVSNRDELPDGWVACSERLPEETKDPDGGATGYLVLYAEGKEPNGGFSVGVWNVTYLRQWWRGFITHWMPLPAAPQQEVK